MPGPFFLSQHASGCDGSSGHSEYKQNFSRDGIKDSNLFLTTLVPLRWRNKDNKGLIYWQNSRPSSTRFCRPIRFEFEKESDDVTKTENARMERAIERLVETQIEAGGKVFKVEHVLILTMVDGKVVQTLQNTPGMNTCSHCKATPTQMNKLHTVRNLVIKDEDLPFNIPSLHARIKFMECCLHISYRQTFQKWRVDEETKGTYGAEKIRIQGELQRRLGIKVDFVKVGMGSSNDGNTARRFFANPAETASITGVSEELISRFATILTTINCTAEIDPDKFERYCNDTADLYVQLYSWYYMPNAVHKILIHGSLFIRSAELPIGMLTEEAQEASNKEYRKARLNHAQKMNHTCNNEDVVHMLLASSRSFNINLRKVLKKVYLELDDNVKALLVE